MVRICQPTDIGLVSYEVSVVTRVIVKLRNPLLLLYSFSHAQVVLVIVCSLNSCEHCLYEDLSQHSEYKLSEALNEVSYCMRL